jgi:hypothetical protein
MPGTGPIACAIAASIRIATVSQRAPGILEPAEFPAGRSGEHGVFLGGWRTPQLGRDTGAGEWFAGGAGWMSI